MTTSTLKKFLVLYLVPTEVLASWAKTDPATKKAAEQKMQSDWQRWMGDHAKMITVTEGAGKTKAVTSAGMEADTHDIAAKAFANHPHLTIPQSSIQSDGSAAHVRIGITADSRRLRHSRRNGLD